MSRLIIFICIAAAVSIAHANPHSSQSIVAAGQSGNGSFLYYGKGVKDFVETQRSRIIKAVSEAPTGLFSKFPTKLDQSEMISILSDGFIASPAVTRYRTNPSGMQDPLLMDYGTSSTGQKYIEILNPLVLILSSMTANEQEKERFFGVQAFKEILHHKNYNEDDSTKWANYLYERLFINPYSDLENMSGFRCIRTTDTDPEAQDLAKRTIAFLKGEVQDIDRTVKIELYDARYGVKHFILEFRLNQSIVHEQKRIFRKPLKFTYIPTFLISYRGVRQIRGNGEFVKPYWSHLEEDENQLDHDTFFKLWIGGEYMEFEKADVLCGANGYVGWNDCKSARLGRPWGLFQWQVAVKEICVK